MTRPRPVSQMSSEELKSEVRKAYARVAQSVSETQNEPSCCSPQEADTDRECSCGCGSSLTIKRFILESMGYSVRELPPSAIESFAGCGNPVAIADLREGEIVLDLGSGAGLDVFMAAKTVGERGHVIGVDMTPEMIQKANENARQLGLTNVEFRLGDIESLPLDDESVDVVISNCVINLVPDKGSVFREAYRVLRPGGRMMVSDIVLERPLSQEVHDSIVSYTSCLGGAILEKDYLELIRKAGFVDVCVMSKSTDGQASSVRIRALRPGITPGCLSTQRV